MALHLGRFFLNAIASQERQDVEESLSFLDLSKPEVALAPKPLSDRAF
jgi:hypothetical protein